MTDPRLDRYAHLICEHSLGIDASHRLLINGPREGSPLMVATAREAWRRGARVSVDMAADWVVTDVLRHGSDAQVAYLDPAELEMVDGFDRWLFVWAPGNSAERAGIAKYDLAFQSAGRTPEPWTGPELSRVIDDRSVSIRKFLVVPIGFVCDHTEILFDIDVQAAQAAREFSTTLRRTGSLNTSPTFIAMLEDLVRSRLASRTQM